MSPAGPSALGTLLAQRLDAVLGVPLSQQSNIASGARPDAVAQPAETAGSNPVRDETLRHPQENVDNSAAQTQEQQRAAPTSAARAGGPAAAHAGADGTDGTIASAPTMLGRAARAILALLDAYPDPAPPLRGSSPLLDGTGHFAAGPGPSAAMFSGSANEAAARASAGTAGNTAPAGASDGAVATAATGAAAAPPGPGTGSSQAVAGDAGVPQAAGASPKSSSTATAAAAARGIANSPGPLAEDLAQALRLALEHSGLFYESHLGELLAGRRSLAALRQEPQAMLGARPQAATDAGTPQARQATSETGLAAQGGTADLAAATPAMPGQDGHAAPTGQPYSYDAAAGRVAAAADTASLAQGDAHAASTGGVQASALLHLDSRLLVRQQLETLAAQAIDWRGAAWPGAAMDWRVERRDTSQEPGQPPAHWASRLTLRLPRLGTVQARLTLAGNSLALRLASPEAAVLLESASPDLRARLLGQGLQLSGLAIGAEPLPEAGAADTQAAGAQAADAQADGVQADRTPEDGIQAGGTQASDAQTGGAQTRRPEAGQ